MLAILLGVLDTHYASTQESTYTATHYGTQYQGRPLGCSGAGTYSSNNTSILAVGPALYNTYPCDTNLQVTGPAGTIQVIRQDSCPGCTHQIDLSEAGITQVCGSLGSCRVTLAPATPAPAYQLNVDGYVY